MRRVTIVGGGLSGVLTALQLLKRKDLKIDLDIIDKNAHLGLGTAYSTTEENHLLNVPAFKMSLWPDQPNHFVTWLEINGYMYEPSDFVPRMIYGNYIQDTFYKAVVENQGKINVSVVRDTVIKITDLKDKAVLTLASSCNIISDRVILAFGNFPPKDPAIKDMSYTNSVRYKSNPWSKTTFNGLKEDDTVLLVGSGLTMVDMVMSLKKRNHKGKIISVSTHGYLPRIHEKAMAYEPFYNTKLRNCNSILKIVKVVNREIKKARQTGISELAVIDSLRNYTQKMWMNLPLEEKKKFQRHLKSLWDVHRHRIPTYSGQILKELMNTNQLEVIAGRLLSINESGDHLNVTIKQRGKGQLEFTPNLIINCTGPDCNYEKSSNPLIKDMVLRGILKNDPTNFGVDANIDGSFINSKGMTSQVFYTIGPPLKGILFETTAVPEIRQQAKQLADMLQKQFVIPLKKKAA